MINEKKLNYINGLFALVENCAKHGTLNRLSGAAMEEIKEFDKDPEKIKEPEDGGKPNV